MVLFDPLHMNLFAVDEEETVLPNVNLDTSEAEQKVEEKVQEVKEIIENELDDGGLLTQEIQITLD